MIWLRSKNGIAAVFAVVIASLLLLASFYNTDAEVYLFPRITAVLVALLALILVYDVISHKDQHKLMKKSLIDWKTLLPGLTVGVVYVLLLEQLGFYVCSFLAFFMICKIYGKRAMSDLNAFGYKLMVTIVFMAVLYVLFWKLLQVRTPTGIFM